jgi:hypothetical protein
MTSDVQSLLVAGEEALRYTKSKIRFSSINPWDILFSGFSSVAEVATARSYEDELLEEIKKKYGAESITCLVSSAIRAKAAERHGVGNCGENAAVAFLWLYLNRPRIRPLDYCNRRNGNHSFIVIGSPVMPKFGNLEAWWQKGVICDPYNNFAFTGRTAVLGKFGTTDVHSLCRVETPIGAGDGIARSIMNSR